MLKSELPRLLENPMEGLLHSTFMNMVVNGESNPYFEWEKNLESDFMDD